ncbi:MAG: RNA methyltransferase [Alphaproteobacteria bacterium]|mgnify:CR=1 FL=1|nr:RNA methyltransferase [Hyphomonas sp.]MBR9808821.1 RNA methyltransferase [Alphaproteobacteria bacterium]|tara:strand:+ start:2158 stop:2985 length:828 start_codon:yes stop_codon:yes gene_type:complete
MHKAIEVDRADDPRLQAYTSIREKDLTSGHGARFIIEGKVTLETALRRGQFRLESLFLATSRLEPLADLLAGVPEDVPVYVAPQDVMDAVAGFPMHRGVLACGIKGDIPSPAKFLDANARTGGPSTLLMLSELSNHDNVGACFRNAAAFGADAVLMEGQCCDPLYRKAIRVSSGASLWLPYAHGGTGADMVNTAKAAGYEVWAMTPRAKAQALGTLRVPEKLAILLGAEGPGLPDDLITAATPVRIPMSTGFDSVNVATAGAITLAHVFGSREGS